MYDKYHRYPELIRLIGAVAVSPIFREALVQDPLVACEQGLFGFRFDLTPEQARLVSSAKGADAQQFSLQVWEWMDHDGQEDGHNGTEEAGYNGALNLLEDDLIRLEAPRIPRYVNGEKKAERHVLASEPRSLPWNGRIAMEPLILVVDDNREMAKGLRFALEMEGFQVILASDGREALTLLEHESPDLILADVKMPRVDGFALLEAVKAHPAWRDIPFVFVTAAADWRDAVVAKSMGAYEYIVKPFELDDLMSVVRRLVHVPEGAPVQPCDDDIEQES
ncbi:MAG: response regulator [Chloroflexota bacterium]